MESSQTESVALVAAVVGCAILGAGSHAVGPAVGDVAILVVLFSMDSEAARSGFQSWAFAGVSGFCLLTPIFFLANNILGAATPSDPGSWILAGVWAVLSVILFGVDRFRMSAKENVSLAGGGLAGAPARPITTSAPPLQYRPAPIRVETPAATPYAQPTYMPPAPVAYAQPQAPPPPAYVPPPPLNTPIFVTEATAAPDFPVPAYASQPMAAPVAAPAPDASYDVTAIPPGREALIYLNLVGEGLNVLRTVRAENLGRDYYRIADVMPESEQWEFVPGQVVKCRKKALSNGKHMVAYEEAPRAQ